MKISSLYTKNHAFPWITMAVTICCLLVTTLFILFPHLYTELAWSNQPKHFWQYVSGAFLHGDETGFGMAVAHLVANCLMFIPYAIMIEKLIGHQKFGIVFLTTWICISIVFQIITHTIIPAGKLAYGNGLSGSSFAVTIMGAYILFRVFSLNKKYFFRQPLGYIFISGLLGELISLHPGVAGIHSMMIHLAGIALGILLVLIYKKSIDSAITALENTSAIDAL